MKKYFTLITLLLTITASGDYLTVIKESMTVSKQNGKIVHTTADKPEISTIYYHDGVMAMYKNDTPTMIIDGNKGKIYNFITESQYVEKDLKKLSEVTNSKRSRPMKLSIPKNSFNVNTKFKNLNRSKTIKGYTCKIYQSIADAKQSFKVKKQKFSGGNKITATSCYMDSPPAAYRKYIKKFSNSLPNRLTRINIESDPQWGLEIHSETEMRMSAVPTSGSDPKVAEIMKRVMPTTIGIEKLKDLHTKPFDKKWISLPQGATKFERPKVK